jgi:transcriptional regulator
MAQGQHGDRSKNAATPAEQVAAKITRTNENGSWILASVQRFYAESETYDVQDEDDTSKLIRLPWTERLCRKILCGSCPKEARRRL